MKRVFACFAILFLPCVSYAECKLEKVDNIRDQYLFPSDEAYKGKLAYICGKGHCENGTVIGVKPKDGKFYIGSGLPGKSVDTYTPNKDEVYAFSCRTGMDDKWTNATSTITRYCGFVDEDYISVFKSGREIIGKLSNKRAIVGKRTDALYVGGYEDLCILPTCSKEGERYAAFKNASRITYYMECSKGVYVIYGDDIWADHCYEPDIPTKDTPPSGYDSIYDHDMTVGCAKSGSGFVVPELDGYRLLDTDTFNNPDYVCEVCREGYLNYKGNCYDDEQYVWCRWYIDNKGNAEWDYDTDECKCKRTGYTWDTVKHECSKGGKRDTTVNDSQNTSSSQSSAPKKSVEEKCREYNGGVDCSDERLACYKKGSATSWVDGKCKCKDTNRQWQYNNDKTGQCVAKGSAVNNDTPVCKTGSGDLKVGESFDDVSAEDCAQIEKTETSVDLVESWKIICETGLKIKCRPYTCINGYKVNEQTGKCVEDKAAQAAAAAAAAAAVAEAQRQQEIDAAKKVVADFFESAQGDKNVWKNAEGKFNTARLASDMTAGVVLGTVGGVVSGVVIKKKQVQKGFEALHCTVGGQKVADWGDTFWVGLGAE